MAKLELKRKENAPGDFYVDNTCIDCGTCYWMAPEIFQDVNDQSAVVKQPNENQKTRALQAVLSCPTFSIGAQNHADELKKIKNEFPIRIADTVFHMGFHSEKSFGAASYLIQRDEGNVLVDSPRFQKHLVKKLEDLGGVRYQYLTHKDDIADTDLYWQHFQGERILHKDDANAKTKHYEILLEGEHDFDLAKDLKIISVPGHTKGSTVLLHKDFLFTGDHLAWSRHFKHLYAFKTACWYDFGIQTESMKKLLNYDFTHVLPGHGAPLRTSSLAEMHQEMLKCIDWLQAG